jgi:hypothetical protein
MTRRLLLERLLDGAWVVTGVGLRWLARVRIVVGSLMGAASVEAAAPRSADVVETLVALAESIVDGEPLSTGARQDLAESIADTMRRDEDGRAVYRAAAALLDRLAEGRFAGLDLGDRVALVRRHRLDVRATTPVETPDRLSDEKRVVQTRVVPDLIAAYWRSPAGWAAVGYEAFPGRCGALTRYTRSDA